MVKIEAVAQKCSAKEVFLEISQNSQENTRGQSCRRQAATLLTL